MAYPYGPGYGGAAVGTPVAPAPTFQCRTCRAVVAYMPMPGPTTVACQSCGVPTVVRQVPIACPVDGTVMTCLSTLDFCRCPRCNVAFSRVDGEIMYARLSQNSRQQDDGCFFFCCTVS